MFTQSYGGLAGKVAGYCSAIDAMRICERMLRFSGVNVRRVLLELLRTCPNLGATLILQPWPIGTDKCAFALMMC